MSDYDMSIHSSTDAREWTDFFFKTYPNCNVDREAMIGWFANAMMAMYDAKHTVKLEIGKHYRTEDGRVYKVIHEDDDGHWTANIREGISQRHPVIITDAWGRNRFGQDLIEEITK